MSSLNDTHDPNRRSHVASANAPDCDFPIQNLPFGMFSTGGGAPRPGVAIGDRIVDLAALLELGLLTASAADAARAAVAGPALNGLMALGNGAASALRGALSDLLDAARGTGADLDAALVAMADATMHLPTVIGNFTDFLTSKDHFTRFRTGPLALNFQSLPIAYHSRASSVVLDGDFQRPHVISQSGDGPVTFAPTVKMDYELEMGFFIGPGNDLGQPIRIGAADAEIWGYCLLNDWSMRDAQSFESAPLGPFQAKSLSTTISPWVVTEEALRPFRVPARARAAGELAPLPHLHDTTDQAEGALNIQLDALILSEKAQAAGVEPTLVTRTNMAYLYWTCAQMLTHHSSNGCNMRPGDLLGTGTISGPESHERACLGEVTNQGKNTFELTGGEVRTFLEDGDEVILRGRAMRDGHVTIGFGQARGRVLPAIDY